MIEPQRLLDDPELADDVRELLQAIPKPQEPGAAKTAALAAKLAEMAAPAAKLAPAAAAPAAKSALWLKVSLIAGAVGLASVGVYLSRSPNPAPVAAQSEPPQVASNAAPSSRRSACS